MPLLPTIGRTVGTGIKAFRILVRGGLRSSAWATRTVGDARARGAANETGMIRLFDLHALSCAGDTLITIGLAGTIFFNVPLGEARGKVALYLLITMIPFALLAPVAGPLLDHFRHGRRYALAVTMLGRAFLAYVISDNLLGWGLYPAAFGVLALSRSYGVARSAAVPRLLPEGVGLSQVGARASVYGTFAGAVVAPIGLLAFKFGPQWPLRVSSIIFLVGVVVALRLPPRADSDPPEAVPRPFRTMLRLRRGTDRPLSGSLVINTLIGSASFRCLYGFMLLYFAFAVKAGGLSTSFFGTDIGSQGAVALVGGSLAVGTFLATAVGTRLRIRRPIALQSSGLTLTAGVAVLAAVFFTLPMVALLSLVTAVFSGISKLAVDASIQERVPERLRASAFAHSETVLMIAWVLGGAIGIIPLDGHLGIIVAAALAVTAAVRGTITARALRKERLHGRPDQPTEDSPIPTSPAGAAPHSPPSTPTPEPWPSAPSQSPQATPTPSRGDQQTDSRPAPEHPAANHPTSGQPAANRPAAGQPAASRPASGQPAASRPAAEATPPPAPPTRKRGLFSRSKTKSPGIETTAPAGRGPDASASGRGSEPSPPGRENGQARPDHGSTPVTDQPSRSSNRTAPKNDAPAPPGFHLYRPSSATSGDSTNPDESSR
ncbi:hypothetical protein GCM10010435_43760 [Winogradskya consettensis]|uniref:MFS transporter n=1 Tax=Winogradskya consettensis TaxID=113560 RepID=A0A919T173_9ACTN|nr:MFS transporter [Actinoplanes consettensis]GIM82566.1 hypothetical protein Aco04nite_82150 [Actinoplanes consettensis]